MQVLTFGFLAQTPQLLFNFPHSMKKGQIIHKMKNLTAKQDF